MRFLVERSEVVRKFMERDMHITPEALEVITNASDSDFKEVLSDLDERQESPSVITDEVISQILSSEETIPSSTTKPSSKDEDSEEEVCEPETDSESLKTVEKEEGETQEDLEPEPQISEEERKEIEDKINVHQDITGKSTSEGKVEDFIQLFRDRYEKLSSIIKSREGFQNYTELAHVNRHEGDMVNLVGIVDNKRETRKKDAWLIELEDPSGKVVVYIKDSQRNEAAIEKVKKVVTDEVIGVKAKVPGNLKSDNRSPLVWGNDVVWPNIPHLQSSSSEKEGSNSPSGYAVLISDLHVGSTKFLPEVFEKFLDWLNGEAGNKRQMKMAEEVKYLIIAGDLVDGIGIYPGQQKELNIGNVREQYEKVAELLCRVPDDITIMASPGNHDAVRLAEPQPALYTSAAAPLQEMDIQLVGNPAFFSLEGVKFLVYHGMSFGDLISVDPDLDSENVEGHMREVLRRRHLAPIYGEPMGGRASIAPEKEDYLVIDEIPDILHCGHIHRYGCEEYRGVLMINSATFQEQTVFMKRKGITPTPGRVPIVNLETKETRAINFA